MIRPSSGNGTVQLASNPRRYSVDIDLSIWKTSITILNRVHAGGAHDVKRTCGDYWNLQPIFDDQKECEYFLFHFIPRDLMTSASVQSYTGEELGVAISCIIIRSHLLRRGWEAWIDRHRIWNEYCNFFEGVDVLVVLKHGYHRLGISLRTSLHNRLTTQDWNYEQLHNKSHSMSLMDTLLNTFHGTSTLVGACPNCTDISKRVCDLSKILGVCREVILSSMLPLSKFFCWDSQNQDFKEDEESFCRIECWSDSRWYMLWKQLRLQENCIYELQSNKNTALQEPTKASVEVEQYGSLEMTTSS